MLFSLSEGKAGLQHLSGPSTFDPLEFVGKHMVFNQNEMLVKETIEKALGGKKYSVKLGEDREDVLTYE